MSVLGRAKNMSLVRAPDCHTNASSDSLAKSLGALRLAVPSNFSQFLALKFRVRFLTCPVPSLKFLMTNLS